MATTTDQATAIEQVIADAERHQNDLEPFLALHREDVAIVNIAGRRVVGKDALRAAMSAALDSPLAQVLTTIDVQDIRFVRPDVAIVSCIKHVSDQRDDGGGLPSTAHLTYVVINDAGGWSIASAQTTPILT